MQTHYPKVRGGFSPLQGGWGGQGMGDVDITDPNLLTQQGQIAVDQAAGLIPQFTNNVSTVASSTLGGVPIWVWLAGGVLALSVLMPKR